MTIEIRYEERPPTWKGEPGRLYTPVPRNPEEAAEAVKKLLAQGGVDKITITAIEQPKP